MITAYTSMQTNFCTRRPPMWQQVHSGRIQYLPYPATVENLLLLAGKCLYEVLMVIAGTAYMLTYAHTCTCATPHIFSVSP